MKQEFQVLHSWKIVKEGWKKSILGNPLQVARPKRVDLTASEAEAALQTLTYYGKKKMWK